jgi:hypothetical protein
MTCKFISGYSIEILKTKNRISLQELLIIINVWKKINSNSNRCIFLGKIESLKSSRSKTIQKQIDNKFNYKCSDCKSKECLLLNYPTYHIQCKICGNRESVSKIKLNADILSKQDITKRKSLCTTRISHKKTKFPIPYIVDTTPISFGEPIFLKSDYNPVDKLQNIVIPNKLYWQPGFVIKLSRLINLILEFRDGGSKLQLNLNKYYNKLKRKKATKCYCKINIEGLNSTAKYFAENTLSNLYTQLYQENLNYKSIYERFQGKNSNERKLIMAKRCRYSARAMIIPKSDLKPNEIAIPYSMYKALFEPNDLEYCLINRMPSLYPENISAHRIAMVWNKNCFGLPLETSDGHHYDFDGDALTANVGNKIESNIEMVSIALPSKNMKSYTLKNGLKLNLPPDAIQMHKILTKYKHEISWQTFVSYKNLFDKAFKNNLNKNIIFNDLKDILRLFHDLKGSHETFKLICNISRFYRIFTRKYSLTINFSELKILNNLAINNNIESELNSNQYQIGQFIGDKISSTHMLQLISSLGYQISPNCLPHSEQIDLDPYIKGNLLNGLNPYEQLVHSQVGFCNMLTSTKEVWIAGYAQSKLSHSIHDCVVDSNLNLQENNNLISKDILDFNFYQDLLPQFTLKHLIEYS